VGAAHAGPADDAAKTTSLTTINLTKKSTRAGADDYRGYRY
jgi:hypothetical protein